MKKRKDINDLGLILLALPLGHPQRKEIESRIEYLKQFIAI